MEDRTSTPFTPAGVVADASARLGDLDELLWAARTPEELVGAVEELEALRCRLAAVQTTVLAEIDARQVPKTHLGWGSTADWFTHLAGTHRSTGHTAPCATPASCSASCPTPTPRCGPHGSRPNRPR
jgi:hypothetical protein